MERLTEKSIGCFKYDLKDFEHKAKEFNDYDAFYQYNLAVCKLGEFEDFMEENGFESLEYLKNEMMEDATNSDFYKSERDNLEGTLEECSDELQAYRKAWKELKEYLITTIKEKDNSPKYYKFRDILDKMQELEPKTEGEDE